MKLLFNAWLWFGLFLIGLYFVTTAGLGALHKWVYDTTPSVKTAQRGSEYATEQAVLHSSAVMKCETEGYKVIAGVCNE